MLASAGNFQNPTIMQAGVIAILGYAVVFFGLILLMLVVMTMSKFFTVKSVKEHKAAESAETPAAVPAPAAAVPETPAPGSAGQLKLHDVPPKTAAILMAIVAHQMGKPLNELRFISIKEVK